MNRGKTRLAKWYNPYNDDEKIKLKGVLKIPGEADTKIDTTIAAKELQGLQ